MVNVDQAKLDMDHKIDARTSRHFVNGVQSVFHCHHYTCLYTQLAIDARETDLLQRTAEEEFYEMLKHYFKHKHIKAMEDRIDIACQYYTSLGLGEIEIVSMGDFQGEVKSTVSLLDEGWIEKWGTFDEPVNYIGCGYISAMFSAILDVKPYSYQTKEVQSMVMNAPYSLFKVIKK